MQVIPYIGIKFNMQVYNYNASNVKNNDPSIILLCSIQVPTIQYITMYIHYTGFLKEHVSFMASIKLGEKTQVAHLDIPWVSLKEP